MKGNTLDYEKLKQCWYLVTSGIHSSKTIPNYKVASVLDSFNFSTYLQRSRKEIEETFEEWANHRGFKFKPLTLNLLFNEQFQPWSLVFETIDEAEMYDLIHKYLMVSKEITWDYNSSAIYNFSKASYATDFRVKQENIEKLSIWCFNHRPDLLMDSRIASILTKKPLAEIELTEYNILEL